MTRREFILTAACFIAVSAHPAYADVESDVARRLDREGFQITRRRKTWLGRIRIEAWNGVVYREVVFDPMSGEILRDYTSEIVDGATRVSARGDRSRSTSTSGGSSSGAKEGSGTSSTSGGGSTSSTDSGGVSGSSGGTSETPKETPSGPSQETSRESSAKSSTEKGKGSKGASRGGT